MMEVEVTFRCRFAAKTRSCARELSWKMASSRSFHYCGHCDQSVSLKTFKEHERLYFYHGRWIKDRNMVSGPRSRSSSPLCVSDPPSPINHSHLEKELESDGVLSLSVPGDCLLIITGSLECVCLLHACKIVR